MAILCVLALAALILLAALAPYVDDDWDWGGPGGLERLAQGFADYNGRYLGNVLVLLLTRSRALKAAAVVDGREEEAVILDGAFEEDWGDCLYLQSLIEGEKKEVHTLKITVLEAPKEAPSPFYLVSLLAAL